jgi:PAS domain S-box-containing protein
MFDYWELRRWRIPESALPSGSIIVHRPKSLYQEHRGAVWGVALFTGIQATAIGLLITSRIKRKRYAQALQESEEKLAGQVRDFELLLKVIPVGIGIAEDPECRSIRVNPAFAELLGTSVDENASKTKHSGELPFRVMCNDQEVPSTELPMQVAAREGREVRNFELEIVRADGRIVHEFGHATPLFDQYGKVRGSLGVFVDLTERNRAEEALRQSETRFRQLADSMPQIVWTSQPDGYLDYYNQRWYEFTAFPEGGGGDESWKPVLHPDDVQRCLDGWYSSVNSGEPYQIEYRFWDRRTNRYRWQLGRALPARDSAGKIVKWFGTTTDIDDQKRTEEDLRRANADLEQFAYSASHDLQEPLRNISIYSQLLARRYDRALDARAHEFLAFLVEGATRMELLLQGLLAYTEVSGHAEEPSESVDANQVLRSALISLQRLIEQNCALVTHEALPRVRVHSVHLQQLFQNLISNAIKYRGETPPMIHISAPRDGSGFVFSVRDNGIGIDPQYSQHVFGIFKRLHTRRQYPGAGIGLAICQRIVERHGGSIWVESNVGQGANFRFILPVEQATAAS